ncbi:MAG TPA: ribosome recycling factor [Acidobacteriota bacterium]
MLEQLYGRLESKMEASLTVLAQKLRTVRTGRANVGILDGIKVSYYGTDTPLNQLAGLAAPEPHLITVQPYDPSALSEIERAIQAGDLGLNPMNDGKMIRVPIPQLTAERREQLAKHVSQLAEEAKTAVRQLRREGNDEAKKLSKDKKISEDEERTALAKVQELTDRYVGQIDAAAEKKRKEILTL